MKGDQRLWQVLNDKLETLRANKQPAEARRVAQAALDLARRSFSEDDPRLIESCEKLGGLLEEENDLAAARRAFVEAHTALEKKSDQIAVFRSARHLARICERLGQADEAVAFFERAIAAGNQARDLPFAELGALLNNAALSFRKAGRAKAAEPYYRHALQIYENQLGAEHPDVAAILNNLAVFYTNEKRFTEAEHLHLRALAIRQRAYSPEHPDVAQSKCNLAVVYHSHGDYTRAAELYRDALAVWDRMSSPPPDYEIMAANYADLLRALGQHREARKLEQRARQKRGA